MSNECRGAVAFLAREAATRDYRLDAAHLAICLQAAGVLDTSPADAGRLPACAWETRWGTGQRARRPRPPPRPLHNPVAPPRKSLAGAGGRGVDVGALIHRYAKEFLYTDPPLALEYYMLAAQAMGGSVQVRAGGSTALVVSMVLQRQVVRRKACRPCRFSLLA